MARRRRRQDRDETDQRGSSRTSSLLLDEVFQDPIVRRRRVEPSDTEYYSILPEVEDRRLWHPLGDLRPAGSVRGGSSVIEVYRAAGLSEGKKNRPLRGRPFRSPFLERGQLQFRVPDIVAKCVRRSERREVLFAKRKTGKGSKSPRHRDYWSDVSCGRR